MAPPSTPPDLPSPTSPSPPPPLQALLRPADPRGTGGTGGTVGGDPTAADAQQPTPFDAVDEYRSLLQLTAPPGQSPRSKGGAAASPDFQGGMAEENVYQQLMAKERRVLDTIDRVINDAEERSAQSTVLFRMPLHELVMQTLGALRGLWEDLISAASVRDATDAVLEPNRMPFIGVALVALATSLALLSTAM